MFWEAELQELFDLQDLSYKAFHEKLIPNIDPNRVIGVRTPVLRKFAKEYAKTPDAKTFMNSLPHRYYEENNLHAFMLEGIKDYGECIRALNEFLPYVDNWATCDSMTPKVFKKHKAELLEEIKRWIKSDETYVVRFGIEMLMTFYLDEDFKDEYLLWVSEVVSEEYYVKMMIAWYYATALAKQWDSTIDYIENKRLEPWIHRKTIQKAVESYRVSDEQKAYLKSFR